MTTNQRHLLCMFPNHKICVNCQSNLVIPPTASLFLFHSLFHPLSPFLSFSLSQKCSRKCWTKWKVAQNYLWSKEFMATGSLYSHTRGRDREGKGEIWQQKWMVHCIDDGQWSIWALKFLLSLIILHLMHDVLLIKRMLSTGWRTEKTAFEKSANKTFRTPTNITFQYASALSCVFFHFHLQLAQCARQYE